MNEYKTEVTLTIRGWVLYLLLPIHIVQFLLGKNLWMPKLAIKTYHEK